MDTPQIKDSKALLGCYEQFLATLKTAIDLGLEIDPKKSIQPNEDGLEVSAKVYRLNMTYAGRATSLFKLYTEGNALALKFQINETKIGSTTCVEIEEVFEDMSLAMLVRYIGLRQQETTPAQ